MLSNPVYDPYLILTKVYSDGTLVKQAIADTYIEEQYRSRTVKIVYGVLENDGYFDFCIKQYADKSPKLAVRTVLKIALYMLLFMDKKRFMVTDCSVELLKKLGKSGVSGFVNAFLRRFDRAEADAKLPKGDDGDAILYSYPRYAYAYLKKEYGERAKEIAVAKSAGVCVRFEKNEENYDFGERIKTPFPHSYIYKNFERDEGYDKGEYTFQSVGSQAICALIDGCDEFLDACSAPGGKSVLLAKKCKKVTAFELHPHRVELIRQYKIRMGVDNVFETQKDSSVYDENYKEKFDGVLCDVPCSGFGVLTENPDVRLFRKEEDFVSLKKAQSAILETCSSYVKNGGTLYYSTCSLFERENDGIVGAFLKNHPEFTVEKTDSPLVHDKKKYGLQFLPDKAYGAGFYVAKLKKGIK